MNIEKTRVCLEKNPEIRISFFVFNYTILQKLHKSLLLSQADSLLCSLCFRNNFNNFLSRNYKNKILFFYKLVGIENVPEKRRRTLNSENQNVHKETVNNETLNVQPSTSQENQESSDNTKSASTFNTPNEVLTPSETDSTLGTVDNAITLQSSLFNHLKEQLARGDLSRIQKIQMLTLLPPEWSYRTIQENFENVSLRMIATSKSLYKDNGVLSTPDLKQGRFILEVYLIP